MPYGYAYLHGRNQAIVLMNGRARMPANFVARLCGVCSGAGVYKQTYTAGCGLGYYQSEGQCDNCDGYGLMVGDKPAPISVVNQVIEAAKNTPGTTQEISLGETVHEHE